MVKSDNESLAVLEARIRAAPTKYVGLATGVLGAGVEFTAGTAPGYARVAVPYVDVAALIDDGFGNLTATLKNSGIAQFPSNSGAGPWPTPDLMQLFDALTGGSAFREAELAPPAVVVLPGQAARFSVGALTHTEA